jgi:hypothetical protein
MNRDIRLKLEKMAVFVVKKGFLAMKRYSDVGEI